MTDRSSPPEAASARTAPGSTGRGAAREAAILQATAELVAELGYDGVTVDAIASRARASKATMYRHWPNKAALVAAGLRHAAEGRTSPIADTGSVRGDLLTVVREISAAAGDGNSTGPSLLNLAEPMRRDPELRMLVRSQIRGRAEHEARLLAERGTRRGEHVDLDSILLTVELALAFALLVLLLDDAAPSDDAMSRLVDRLLLPPPRPSPPETSS